MEKVDAIIFDVDGTLWDSREKVAQSWNQAMFDTYGREKTLTSEILTPLFGKTMNEIMDAAFPELDKKEQGRAAEVCYEYENRLLMEEPGIYYPGVDETIKILSEKYPLFIVSNCQCGYIEAVIKHLKNGNCIRDFLCYGDTKTEKDQTLRKLMEKHGLKNPVYVGDTAGDAKACRLARIPIIFAAYGLGEIKEEDYIEKINSIEELVSVMERI